MEAPKPTGSASRSIGHGDIPHSGITIFAEKKNTTRLISYSLVYQLIHRHKVPKATGSASRITGSLLPSVSPNTLVTTPSRNRMVCKTSYQGKHTPTQSAD